MKVLHIITGLERGGAEEMLYCLVTAMAADAEHVVISLTGEGVYGPRLTQNGVLVHTLQFPRGRLSLRGLHRLWRLIKNIEPDVIQTWLYQSDLVGGLIGRLAGVRVVCWGIHNSTLSRETSSTPMRLAARACAWISDWVPAAIACCSERAALVHRGLGYPAGKLVVIRNGYDLARFSPRPEARERLRREWSVAPGTPLLGMAARWHPQKDHANLLRALALIARRGIDFRCVLAGSGIERSNLDLTRLISESRLEDKVLLLGPRDDMPDVMNALDLHVLSSSHGEAFPNVVAEAMACGTPCAVTDVGDSAMMVDDTGWVAPPGDAAALAQRIEQALQVIQTEARDELSKACRQRIAQRFGIERMVAAYKELWSRHRTRLA